MKSIWDIQTRESFLSIDKNIDTDILIIGGGISGISLLYYLKKYKYNVTLIEQNTLGSGVTYKTTGKLTYLQSNIYQKIKSTYGLRIAAKYYESQKSAIREIRKIIKEENIDCDLQKSDSYIFSHDTNKLIKESNLLNKIGIKYQIKERLPLSINEEIAIKVNDTYVFHPIKYIYGLIKTLKNSENINIYENTRLIDYVKTNNGYQVNTNSGNQINTKIIVFACNYPPFIMPYLFPLKTYLEKSDIYLYKRANKNFNAINIDKKTKSIRYHKDNLLYLCNSRKLAQNNNDLPINKNYKYMWTNYDVMTLDYLPIAGPIDNDIYLMTGYNTWGMTNSNVASRVIRDLILKRNNKYSELYKTRKRKSLKYILNIIGNLFYTTYAFTKSYLKRDKHYLETVNGTTYGVYIDKQGIRHTVKVTCPHMGCGLRFNKHELTWDCICHGSKFDIDGNIIKGPSILETKTKDE